VLGLEISARTNRFLRLFGCLKATMGGSGKIYHPCLRNSFNTIREHWTFVEKNSKLSKIFPEPPMVAFNGSVRYFMSELDRGM
jgi:hypothetical protein